MKKTMISGIVLIMTACLTLSAMQTNAQKKDEDAIKKVLHEETSTYFHKNYEGWADTWAHDSADNILNAGPYHHQEIAGWNAIAAQYKKDIEGLSVRSDAEIAPFLNKTDYHIYINGNMATASFKEGDKTPNTEMRTMVKQNGAWKILNMAWINNASYAMTNTMNNMKAFAGKWVLDGKGTMEPSMGAELNSAKFELNETPNGLEQHSNFAYTYKNQSFAPPTDYEYFVPDYNTATISYMNIRKNASGQTFTHTGKVTSNQPNSFTVTVMYPDKPTAIQNEYTVTMQNGKWHQVDKNYDRDGKQVNTSTINLRRME